jgi:hypothetical protein
MSSDETLHDITTVSDIQEVNGHWQKWCLDCEKWIGLGPNGSEHTFLAHRGSKQCQRTRDRKTRTKAREALNTLKRSPSTISFALPPAHPSSSHLTQDNQEVLSSDPSPPPPSLALPVVSPGFFAPTTSNASFSALPPPSPITFPPLLAPGLPLGRLLMDSPTSAPTSHGLSLTSPASSNFSSFTSASQAPEPCNGVPFKWEHGSPFLVYPFQYHETGHPTWSLDGIGEPEGSHTIRFRSHSCTHFREYSAEACLPCKNLISSPKFQNMLKSASQDPPPNTPYLYLSWKQATTKLRSTAKELQQERKKVFYSLIEDAPEIF